MYVNSTIISDLIWVFSAKQKREVFSILQYYSIITSLLFTAKFVRRPFVEAILKYVDGVTEVFTYAHKGNVEKHNRSGSLHQWAKDKFFNKDSSGTQSQAKPQSPNTLTRNRCVSEPAKKKYSRLFNSTFLPVRAEKPFAVSHLRLECKREMAWNVCQPRMILVSYLSISW